MLTVIISHFFEQDMIFLPFATSLLMEQNFERAPMQRKTCSSGGFPWNKTDQQRFHKNWEIIACSASKELLWLFWLVLVYWTGVLLGQKIRGSDSGTFFLPIWSTVNSLSLLSPILAFTYFVSFNIGLYVRLWIVGKFSFPQVDIWNEPGRTGGWPLQARSKHHQMQPSPERTIYNMRPDMNMLLMDNHQIN